MKDVSQQLRFALSISHDQSFISSIDSGGGTTESSNTSLAISDNGKDLENFGVVCFMYRKCVKLILTKKHYRIV